MDVRWRLSEEGGFPDGWEPPQARGATPAEHVVLAGTSGLGVAFEGARPSTALLQVDGEIVARAREADGFLPLPASHLAAVGLHELVFMAVGRDGQAHAAGMTLVVALDRPTGAWGLPVQSGHWRPATPWARAARFAAQAGAGATTPTDLAQRIATTLWRGLPGPNGAARPAYDADSLLNGELNPPWDLRHFLSQLEKGQPASPLACDGAAALVALLTSLLGGHAGWLQLQPKDPAGWLRFRPYRAFGAGPRRSDPQGTHRLVVVGGGNHNPTVLDPTFDWEARTLDPAVPLRVYTATRLADETELEHTRPMPVLPGPPGEFLKIPGRRGPPSPAVRDLRTKLLTYAGAQAVPLSVWDVVSGEEAAFAVYDPVRRITGHFVRAPPTAESTVRVGPLPTAVGPDEPWEELLREHPELTVPGP